MLSEELKSIHAGLGKLLGKVDPESAEYLRQIRRNLDAATEDAEHLEENLVPQEAM